MILAKQPNVNADKRERNMRTIRYSFGLRLKGLLKTVLKRILIRASFTSIHRLEAYKHRFIMSFLIPLVNGLPPLGRGRPGLGGTAFFCLLVLSLKIGCSGHSVIHFLGCRLLSLPSCLRHRHLHFSCLYSLLSCAALLGVTKLPTTTSYD